MIRRLLIANRGEIALRIIRACRELGVESVAVCSEADLHAPHALAADRAMPIGPPPAAASYLSIARIIEAATTAGADAIHPGYGFLSENAAFAEACAAAGLVFVGPPAAVLATMGSKIQARRLAERAGVPVVPGEIPEDQSDAGVRRAVERIGLPALIKPSAGGGGKGMRRVGAPGEVDEAIQAARREATAAFGNGTLYVERLIASPRHVEVQVFADDHGHVVHLFERECSIQRRHQKVIEESPSTVVTPALRAQITAAAIDVARAAQYRNAGTVEFLIDRAGANAFYFLEMNTRLQVEHPVTEQVTGRDLVRAQLVVASGEPLPWTQAEIAQRGHAIEARVYAEDPAQNFMPQAGRLLVYREPHLPGVRVDSGVAEGGQISVYYDPLMAKVIATAETRELAINRLLAALREWRIEGVRTNLSYLIEILDHADFRSGAIDTGFLDRHAADLVAAPPAGVQARLKPDPTLQARLKPDPTLQVRLKPDPTSESDRRGFDPWETGARFGSAPAPAHDRSAPVTRTRQSATDTRSQITAPMPATVIRINVKPGDAVKKGEMLVLLEAMKMELPVRALGDGVVAAVHCRDGELVPADAPLVDLK